MQNVLRFAAEMADNGHKVALITVTETQGSSPASAGQMIAVSEDGAAVGTVGGGSSEYALIQQAVQALASENPTFTFHIDHSKQGMVCGGSMSGYGTILGSGLQLVLFGGGHVAQKIAPLAHSCGFAVTVVEDRPELAGFFKDARYVLATPAEFADKIHITANTYVVICTRGHKTDDEALRFCLPFPYAYLGMIGSQKKVRTLFSALRKEGVDENTLARLYAPIGLDIASALPAEIAVSVVAEMLLVKNGGSPAHKKSCI